MASGRLSFKVVDFPGGGWLEWSPSTRGSFHVSGDEDGGGEETTDPISLLNFKPMNRVHTERDQHITHKVIEYYPNQILDKLYKLQISNSSGQTNAAKPVQKSGKSPTIILFSSREIK